ncbi:MAG: DUF3344 domain-containing protein [Ardenticatenaceae bacterium]|nr:DUF3344 domain-containing protein [Ardenticatenaceae bacterium]MCB8988369.1 DUF3344 domain-containing protein [Ardenticatenaceae bacterium]
MDERKTYSLINWRKYLLLGGTIILLLALATPFALAQTGTEEGPLTVRYTSGEGHYATVSGGAGLEGLSSNTFTLTVPGQAVVAAYLYWAGVNENGAPNDPNVSFQVDGGTVNSLTADVTYGPSFWFSSGGTFNHNVYVDNVTSLVQLGTHNYTLSDYTVTGPAGYSLAYGFGLMVVYQDATLPLSSVTILDGLDSVYWNFPEPRNSPSQVNCVTFAANAQDRVMDFTVFVGGSEDTTDAANRPNSLHYVTGTGTAPAYPTDLSTLPGSGEILDPFVSADGDAWDTYTNSLVVNAGDTYACFQTHSDDVNGTADPDGASFLWMMGGTTLRQETPTAVSLSAISANSPIMLPVAATALAVLLLGSLTGLAVLRRKR